MLAPRGLYAEIVPTPVGVNRFRYSPHVRAIIVPTPVGVNQDGVGCGSGRFLHCPHARGGEPRLALGGTGNW